MIGVAVLWCVIANPVGAQQLQWWQPQIRGDAILARASSYQGAVGIGMPMGNYVRLSLDAGGGTTIAHGESRASARVDLIGRFLIDPFRQTKRGPYGGAGVSWRADERTVGRAYVVALIGIEGRPRRHFSPSIELGLGGGTRIGIVLRRNVKDYR